MIRRPGERTLRPRAGLRPAVRTGATGLLRPAVRLGAAVLLPPALTATAVLAVGPAAAAADGTPTVRLPVMTAVLADDADCTKRSTAKATAVPWEHQSLELLRAARISQGAGVKVGVVDTGVSTEALTLAGRVEALGGGGDDCVGHGTFVAGLIAAAPAKGVAFHGVAPRASIVAVRATTERGTPSAAGVAAGIRDAVDAGAQVVEVSAAFETKSAALDDAVSYAAKHDSLIVAAAVPDPPSGTGAGTPAPRNYWPAAFPGVLSVLDVDVKGVRQDGALLPVDVDLAAPGDGVVGIGPRGGGHFVGNGASLAAGYAAGAAALVRSAFPDLSAAEVARRLISTAYPDYVPRLDAYAAVASVPEDGTKGAGARADAHAGVVRMPDHTQGEHATRTAVLVAAAGLGVLLLAGWAALAVPRGRARGWRPPRR
ncbi:mycosin-4 [Streptomyces atratus]|uniref:S8 family serine peptidase n=1 Tax=Streptomyces atratus TaxID=1893 RepID=UPI00166F9F38|nr:S8 family serine peptidase [Streptomyces atratus]GGT64321.1 mycosin-4 [Streptomyces atratus]